MPNPLKNSQEAKELMKRVREGRRKKPIGESVEENEVIAKKEENQEDIKLPEDKFLLLLNIIMELQKDIDILMSKMSL